MKKGRRDIRGKEKRDREVGVNETENKYVKSIPPTGNMITEC